MEISASYRRHMVPYSDHVHSPLELDQEPVPSTSARDLSFEYPSQSEDEYEYDEEIPKASQEDIYEGEKSSSGDGNSLSSTAGGVTPCWGCKGCSGGTPLFLLGSPADAPCTCISCQ